MRKSDADRKWGNRGNDMIQCSGFSQIGRSCRAGAGKSSWCGTRMAHEIDQEGLEEIVADPFVGEQEVDVEQVAGVLAIELT